jgi:hypothetical protein
MLHHLYFRASYSLYLELQCCSYVLQRFMLQLLYTPLETASIRCHGVMIVCLFLDHVRFQTRLKLGYSKSIESFIMCKHME